MFKLSNTVLIPILTLCSLSASAQWAKVYTTAGDRSQELEPSAVEATSVSANYTVDTNTKFQGIDGFGCAITYASCYNLMQMSETMREELLQRTFSPTEGYGVSYVRISIGCNDFSSGDYTLCDTQGPDSDPLQYFALSSDETEWVIPILKKIKAYNPNLKIIASPWTPPRWMKTSNSWTDAELSSTYYSTYADYFVKFVQAFQAEGLDIYAVTHQNEPMNKGNSASCYMTWETAADFISQALAPKFHAAGLTTKIYLWDHNYNYDNVSAQTDYPYYAIQRMGTNFDGADLVAGAAWHNYVDNPETSYTEMTDIYNKTGKENLFTESSIGIWNDGDNLAGSLARDMRNNVILPTTAYCRGSIVWNFALDVNGKPYVSGGCSTCRGAISVAEDGSSYTCNSHYYDMAHASVSVKVGATNVGTTGSMSNVTISSFLNPDGTVGVLIANTSSSAQTVNVAAGSYTYSFMVPANGVVSAELGLTEDKAKADWVTLPSTTIYYDNTLTQWDTPYLYMWGSGNNATWPGAAMTAVHGYLWKYTTNGLYTGMVFNAGDGDATKGEDHTVTDGKIYANATAAALGEPEDVTHTIYFDNSKAKWAQPYVFAWYSNASGSNGEWPGVAMTRTSADSDIWMLAMPDFYDRLVVTNGLDDDDEEKTDDQVLTDGATYTYSRVVATDYYISGTVTGWVTPGNDDSYQMVKDEDGTIYYNVTYSSANSTLDPNRFKIYQGSGWNTYWGVPTGSVGEKEENPLPGPVTALPLIASGGDIYYASNLDGTYKTIFDPTAVTLTILDPDPEIIYVSGSFNGWKQPGTDGAVPLTYNSEGYYVGYVTLIGSGELCLYTGSGWSGLRYGLTTSTSQFTDDNLAITLDSGVGDNQNVAYNLTEGLYRFTFNPTTRSLTLYRQFSSAIDDLAQDTLDIVPVYYNLMGQRTVNPTSGLYIKVTGTKVQKIVVK